MPIQPKNKKFLAQKEKEEQQKRLILIGTISVLVIVLGLVVYGVLDRYVLQPNTPIIETKNQKIDVVEFEQRIRYERFRRVNQMIELINYTQSLGGTPETYSYFQPQINQLISELQQPALIGRQMIEELTEELIILAEAEKLEIEINDEIIDQEIEKIFGYFPNGTPTPKPTETLMPTSTLSSEQKTLLPPTATPEDTSEDEADGEESEQLPEEVVVEENPDPTATPLLQPTAYTEALFEENYQQAMENLEAEAQIQEKTFRNLVKVYYLREQIIKEITADLEKTQEQVWAKHILVEDQETAEDIRARLDDGESFADLAQEYSVDTFSAQQGGDLGWFGRGMMVPTFEDAAFALDIGEISDPVETDFGWHIIQLIGKEDRPIDTQTYQSLQNQAYSEWLEEKKAEYNPEVNENWSNFVPTEPEVPQEVVEFITFQEQQLQQQQQQQQLLPTLAPESDSDQ